MGNDETVFGIDFETDEIVFWSGLRLPVDSWYDRRAEECSKDSAYAAVFQLPPPDERWLGLIIEDVTKSEVWH